MTFAVMYDVPRDVEMYGRVKRAIGPAVPQGLVVHLVVDQPEGLRHIEVWGSRAQWQQFQQERVGPAVRETLAAAGVSAPPVPPATRELDVVDVWLGA